MSTPLPISVVIPTIGRTDLLSNTARSIADCDPQPAEVIIVDQGGGAASRAAIEILGASCASAIEQEGRGISLAMNAGLREARHDAVLVTHDDCTVRDDWIARAFLLANEHPAAIVTGRVLPTGDDPLAVPATRDDPSPHNFTGHRYTSAMLLPNNMLLPRDRVIDMGGFDERFIAASEDDDLCYRWLRQGGELLYDPDLAVWHHDWRTRTELKALYRRYWYWQGVFYAKYLLSADPGIVSPLFRDGRSLAKRMAETALGRKSRGVDPRSGMGVGLTTGFLSGVRLEVTRRRHRHS